MCGLCIRCNGILLLPLRRNLHIVVITDKLVAYSLPYRKKTYLPQARLDKIAQNSQENVSAEGESWFTANQGYQLFSKTYPIRAHTPPYRHMHAVR